MASADNDEATVRGVEQSSKIAAELVRIKVAFLVLFAGLIAVIVILIVIATSSDAETPSTSSGPGSQNQGLCAGSFSRVNDMPYYEQFPKAFVGCNPLTGDGSGFLYRGDFQADTFGDVPPSNKGRTTMCTCDCKASPDGVGCAGYGGINFRYASLLAAPIKGCPGPWTGQMIAGQLVPTGNASHPEHLYLPFIGDDRRTKPGGEVVYSVALVPNELNSLAGVFRQFTAATSCKAALAEPKEGKDCAFKCGENGMYAEWLAYCRLDTDTSDSTGFRGWGN